MAHTTNCALADNSKKRRFLKYQRGERKAQVKPGSWRKTSSRVVSP